MKSPRPHPTTRAAWILVAAWLLSAPTGSTGAQPTVPAKPTARQPSVATVNPIALRLAVEDLVATFGKRYPRGPEYLRRLDALGQRPGAGNDAIPAGQELRALAREALLANPLLDFDRILVLHRRTRVPAREAAGGALGIGTSNWSTSDNLVRNGEFADTLAVLSNLRGEPRLEPLFAPDNGDTILDPVLHFDADRILFARNGAREKNWRLWELKVGEAQPRQITPDHGADVAHFDPVYLPDGRIIFASTAAYQGLPCLFGSDAMTCLYLFDPRTGATRQLTFEQDSD